MGAQNFKFAPKFSQNGGFPATNLVFLEESFPKRRTFSGRLKFKRGEGGLPPRPPARTPLRP